MALQALRAALSELRTRDTSNKPGSAEEAALVERLGQEEAAVQTLRVKLSELRTRDTSNKPGESGGKRSNVPLS